MSFLCTILAQDAQASSFSSLLASCSLSVPPCVASMESLHSRSRRRRDRLRRIAILKSKAASYDLSCQLWRSIFTDPASMNLSQVQPDEPEEKPLVERVLSFLQKPFFAWNTSVSEFVPKEECQPVVCTASSESVEQPDDMDIPQFSKV